MLTCQRHVPLLISGSACRNGSSLRLSGTSAITQGFISSLRFWRDSVVR